MTPSQRETVDSVCRKLIFEHQTSLYSASLVLNRTKTNTRTTFQDLISREIQPKVIAYPSSSSPPPDSVHKVRIVAVNPFDVVRQQQRQQQVRKNMAQIYIVVKNVRVLRREPLNHGFRGSCLRLEFVAWALLGPKLYNLHVYDPANDSVFGLHTH
jgi:hypothetical protein